MAILYGESTRWDILVICLGSKFCYIVQLVPSQR